MEYADLVLVTVVVVFPLSIAVLSALGAAQVASIGVGSLVAVAVIFHALFVNPPRRRGRG